MTLEERVKALESKLADSGWSIEGAAESKNYSPSQTILILKRIGEMESNFEELKKQLITLEDATNHSLLQIEKSVSFNETKTDGVFKGEVSAELWRPGLISRLFSFFGLARG